MKAPTADYSPLSQALSARTSATQAKYSAKDLSNWSSRYKIQEDSLKLQEKSLDIQQEAVDDAKAQTTWNGVLSSIQAGVNLTNKIVELGDAITSAKQQEMGQTATLKSSQLTSEMQNLLDNNESLSQTSVDPDTGLVTVGLSDEGVKTWNKLVEKYFPSDEKWGWGYDKTISNLKESLGIQMNSYASEIATKRILNETETNYNGNMANALNADLMNGQTVTVDIPDGAGGTRALTLGAQQKAVIDSRSSFMGDSWTYNEYESAANELLTTRGNYILSDITTNFKDGTYFTDPEARAASDAQIEAHLNEIKDPTVRAETEESIKAAKTSAVTEYFENLTSSILAQDKDSYKALETLYKNVTDKDGDFYKFFTETGYLEPSTYTSVRSSIKSAMDTIEETAGTVNTNAVQNGFKKYNAQYRAGQMTSKEYAVAVDNLMATTYCNDDGTPNYNWRNNSEALQVCQTQLEALLPDDLTSDDTFKTNWNIAWQTALNVGDSTLYNDLTPDQQTYANFIKSNMLEEIYKAVLTDPSVAISAESYATALKNISSRYSAEWIDYINSEVGDITTWDAITGKDAKDKFGQSVDSLVKADTTGLLNSITSDGYIDRTSDKFLPGVNDKINETLSLIGTYGKEVHGLNIENPNTGILKFKMDENGEPSLDKDGHPILEAVEWTNITLPTGNVGTVKYDVENDKWIYGDKQLEEQNSEAQWQSERLKEGNAIMQELDGKVPSVLNSGAIKTVTLSDKELEEVDNFIQKKKRVTTEDEKTGDEIVTEVPGVDEADIRDYIGTHAETKAEIDAYITEFTSLHKAGKLMADLSEKDFNRLMSNIRYSLSDEVSRNLQWDKDNEIKVSHIKEKVQSNEDDSTSSYTKWINNHQTASPGEVYQYLKGLDDSELEEAVAEMKEQVDSTGFLLEKFNDPKKALDNYLKKIKEERKAK